MLWNLFRKLAPLSKPINLHQFEIETDRDLAACVFPHFKLFTCFFILTPHLFLEILTFLLIGLCDWFYVTQSWRTAKHKLSIGCQNQHHRNQNASWQVQTFTIISSFFRSDPGWSSYFYLQVHVEQPNIFSTAGIPFSLPYSPATWTICGSEETKSKQK